MYKCVLCVKFLLAILRALWFDSLFFFLFVYFILFYFVFFVMGVLGGGGLAIVIVVLGLGLVVSAPARPLVLLITGQRYAVAFVTVYVC